MHHRSLLFFPLAVVLTACSATGLADSSSTGPSYDCQTSALSSIETLICQQPMLSALDRQLAEIYTQAQTKADNENPSRLKAEQRAWTKGRNDCWKSQDKPQCVSRSYQYRIAELQANYALVDAKGPFRYICDNQATKAVIVNYFDTEPATLIAEFADSTSLMTIQPSGSGARYQGRNESLWEHQGEARISWGDGAVPMTCQLDKGDIKHD